MSSARPPINPQLDQILSHARQPDLPAGLAARIVAQTAALPQQTRREDVVVQVPAMAASAVPVAANENHWMRWGLLTGGVAAVALAVVMAPSLLTRSAGPADVARTQPATIAPSAPPAAPVVESVAAVASPSATKPAEHLARTKHESSLPQPDEQAVTPAGAELAASSDDKVDRSTPAASPEQAAAPERVAQVEGPKAPVQGPPTPFDLIPSSSSTLGLGVAGSVEPAASPPPSNSPGRGPGGPGGGFGGRGGGGHR